MAAQAARLIGLMMLMLELHRRRVSGVEFYGLCAAMVVGLCESVSFLDCEQLLTTRCSLYIGIHCHQHGRYNLHSLAESVLLQSDAVSEFPTLSLLHYVQCVVVRFVPTALLSSFWFIALELYMGGRFLGWDAFKTSFRAMLSESANAYVARACSLLLLDILTVVPNAMDTNRLAQFIPLSVGALIVLGKRSYQPVPSAS